MATEETERREEGGMEDTEDVVVQISSDDSTNTATNVQYFAIQVRR